MLWSWQERGSEPSPVVHKLHALRYLLIQLLLQVLLRPEEFAEAASELVICCKKAFSSPDLLESSGEDEPSGGDGAPELLDVLVDTLLSLLPQSSAPMRVAIEQVGDLFIDFCWSIFLSCFLVFPLKSLESGVGLTLWIPAIHYLFFCMLL